MNYTVFSVNIQMKCQNYFMIHLPFKIPVLEKNISILGCGWLGLPLAISLIANGWKVKGSTTRADKVNLLSDNEIEAFLVQLSNIGLLKGSKFWDSEVLLINVPPGLKRQTANQYLEQMRNLAEVVAASGIKKVIFISSTSVYPELNNIVTGVDAVDESSPLLQSERIFTLNSNFKTTVIRFGGLIGPARDPSRWFAGKKDIPNGRAPVNLIHLDDCLGIIKLILERDVYGETYHAAAPQHPTKAEFYTEAAKNAGLAEPQFVDELLEWKVIDAEKLMQQLGYTFKPL
ncbi:nucleoside-diphosphate-sugar epimerase [Mucilaginibacter gracilis]|uniref:Nucleoside-diphosphate-sugar epimerase n=1 Tax=Mucilaginibacter gracilis TaxID=423350 RepID=A0A495IWI7_9SPHI|nr:SDR family oxidoreductase [Mucilaginibacter gracilis]RKR80873.1 nucleoside-diphosphate-sugar epimerase [Mucilaginibacter gracilis]